MTNRTRIVAVSLAAILITVCTQPEPVVVVVTPTPIQTPEERADDRLVRRLALPTPWVRFGLSSGLYPQLSEQPELC